MDLDGDGVLSMYELEYFYEEQCQKLEAMAIEPLPFEDCLCQMLDLVKPEFEGQIFTPGVFFVCKLKGATIACVMKMILDSVGSRARPLHSNISPQNWPFT